MRVGTSTCLEKEAITLREEFSLAYTTTSYYKRIAAGSKDAADSPLEQRPLFAAAMPLTSERDRPPGRFIRRKVNNSTWSGKDAFKRKQLKYSPHGGQASPG